MQCKEKLETYLQQNHVPFQEQQHERAGSAQQVAQAEHLSSEKMAKVVVIYVDGKMMELALPASSQANLEKVRASLGAKEVLLADEEDLAMAFPDCEIGAMPPFGNLYGLPVYVEKRLANEDAITFSAGTHTDTISMKYIDFANLVHPHMLDFAGPSAVV
ncbi:aminoacyl-tRNA deacylase [Ktedonospora formicarum]|uniref:Deacylase n=1 Tax=Ktedonospora formicarum TaxID=2778364 RepID=A0A8J3IDT5_9CHLR|nr:YbaK/EbsC family protein [Ktedonospora formicarum]GHO50917.1 deacylase [Ktedonospora formicarum]